MLEWNSQWTSVDRIDRTLSMEGTNEHDLGPRGGVEGAACGLQRGVRCQGWTWGGHGKEVLVGGGQRTETSHNTRQKVFFKGTRVGCPTAAPPRRTTATSRARGSSC